MRAGTDFAVYKGLSTSGGGGVGASLGGSSSLTSFAGGGGGPRGPFAHLEAMAVALSACSSLVVLAGGLKGGDIGYVSVFDALADGPVCSPE